MITRIRENEEGPGFVVSTLDADGEIEARTTPDLTKAFEMQKSVQDTGKWPDGKDPKR